MSSLDVEWLSQFQRWALDVEWLDHSLRWVLVRIYRPENPGELPSEPTDSVCLYIGIDENEMVQDVRSKFV
jgi:hypothetical protein